MQNTMHDIINDFLEKLKENFWKRVKKTDACWNWTAYIGPEGYGHFGRVFDRKVYLAHRFSWMLHHESIPEGYWVLHKCDNRKCINPNHLFLGSPSDNVADMISKHRHSHGEKHFRSKLTEDQVKEIRASWSFRKVTAKMLAEKYGVTAGSIRDILYRRCWKHI